jgi:hypothetical protein
MENNTPIIDESVTVIVAPPVQQKNSPTAQRISKLIGQRSIQVAKEEALDESATINEADLDALLSKEDKYFYQVKRKTYLTSYPDLAEDQFDLDIVHLMIMEQIKQRQLLRKKKKQPALNIEEEYDKSVEKQSKFMKSLNVQRIDRMKQKGEKKVENNIAHLSVHFNSEDQIDGLNRRVLDLRAEEEELRAKKGML